MNDNLLSEPKLRFAPRSIALDFDAAFASFLLQLREDSELSRETILSMFDLDQAEEAMFLEREGELYDDIFQTQVPFSTPNPRNGDPQQQPVDQPDVNQQRRQGGRRGGGNRNGGGRAPGSGQGGAPARRPTRKSDRGRDVPVGSADDFEPADDPTTGDDDDI